MQWRCFGEGVTRFLTPLPGMVPRHENAPALRAARVLAARPAGHPNTCSNVIRASGASTGFSTPPAPIVVTCV